MNFRKFEIDCQSFELYFLKELEKATQDQINLLPNNVYAAIYRNNGKINEKAVAKLGLVGKLFVLSVLAQKKYYIVVAPSDGSGASPQQFLNLISEANPRNPLIPDAESLAATGTFVLADNDVMSALAVLNSVSTSNAYNYVMRVRNAKKAKSEKLREERETIARMITHYEASKRRWDSEMDISMAEFLVLLYLYVNKEAMGSALYHSVYVRTPLAGAAQVRMAVVSLKDKFMIAGYGNKRKRLLSITPLGISTVDKIMDKYLLKF